MPSPPVGNISDTARWVAAYRAMESERPDAHFRDPFARELAGEQGARIVEQMPAGRSTAWAFVVRTCVIDEFVTRVVRESSADMVVNLAAGLDTRPYRMELPASLSWVEVDLPAILEYKREKLASARPVCRLESVALDLSDVAERRALFARLSGSAARVLVITEGLLVYLSREEVGALAADLHAAASFRWWILDVVSPDLLRWLQRRYQRSLAAAGAPLRFGPEEGTEFYRPFGWKTAEFRSSFDESRRLRREMPGAWLFRLMMRLSPPARRERMRRMGGLALLERT
jgi:methyltransferase (TIGR00027 family)